MTCSKSLNNNSCFDAEFDWWGVKGLSNLAYSNTWLHEGKKNMTKKSMEESVVQLIPFAGIELSGKTRVKWCFGAQKSAAVTFPFCQINNEGDYWHLVGQHTSNTKHRKIIKRATMTVTCQIMLMPQTLGWALIFDRPQSKYTVRCLKSHGLLVHRLQKKHVSQSITRF